MQLNNKPQALRFRKKNPICVKFVFEVDYQIEMDLEEREYIPLEIITVEYNGNYVITHCSKESTNIVVLNSPLFTDMLKTLFNIMNTIYYLFQEFSVDCRWHAFYGFASRNDIIHCDENIEYSTRITREIYSFLMDRNAGVHDISPVALHRYNQVVKNLCFSSVSSIQVLDELGVICNMLNHFEYVEELDVELLEFPFTLNSLFDHWKFKVKDVRDCYLLRDTVFTADATYNNRLQTIHIYICGREMEQTDQNQIEQNGYFPYLPNSVIYLKIYRIVHENDFINK